VAHTEPAFALLSWWGQDVLGPGRSRGVLAKRGLSVNKLCGARGAGALPALKRRKLERGVDPLKGGFVRAPKRGGNEPLTAAEAAADEAGRKAARKAAKKAGPAMLLKRNVRKKR
jgi:hypothetical protein